MSNRDLASPARVPLARLPTPLEPAPRLTAAWGGPQIWMKRDDLTGFGVSGNKVRKLEYHVAAARDAGATTLITCGAVQSNHCRATAVVAARLGLECILFLRSSDGHPPASVTGNHLLQLLVGAEVRFVTPAEFEDREAVMGEAAGELAGRGETAWVMPAGASDALGVAAFDAAAHELAQQWPRPWEALTIWHASSSGGTTAGLAVGCPRAQLPAAVVGASVGEPAEEMDRRIQALIGEVGADHGSAPFEIVDDYVGRGYGKTTEEELRVQAEASALTGLIWDPTYTGKALYALKREIDRGRFGADDHVVFWHTGGGFAAFAHDFGHVLRPGG